MLLAKLKYTTDNDIFHIWDFGFFLDLTLIEKSKV